MALKFGVLTEGGSVCAAHADSLRQLVSGSIAECAYVIEGSSISPPIPFEGSSAARLRQVSLQDLFPDAPRIPKGTPEAIRDLDFVFNCSFIPASELAGMARHGVWTIFYDPDPRSGVWPPGFWGIFRDRVCNSVVLHQLGPGDGPGFILEQATVSTIRRSYAANLDQALAAGVDLPVHAAKILLAGRQPANTSAASPMHAAALSPWRGLAARTRMIAAWIQNQVAGTLLSEDWRVGEVNAPIQAFLDPNFRPSVEWLPGPGSGKFWADPFALPRGTGRTVLVEEFDYARSQGYISLVEGNSRRVLIDERVHMSYPFPVEHAGELYIIPESQRSHEVALFRFEADGRCRRTATLLRDFAALDSTVFQHAGRWWLLCSCQDDLPDSKLYIFHAPDLFGPWSPHALNPVKCDVRSSRPGGTPFLDQGGLYRPAQDSSAGYGSALSINLVKVLTPDEFQEETVVRVRPVAPYSDGLHTLSSAAAGTLIDGKRMIFAPQLTLRRLRHKISRLTGGSR